LVALAGWVGSWLGWVGWALLIGAVLWASIRCVESRRRLRETHDAYRRWLDEHNLP
jgi:hypothetical protein